MDSDIDRLSDLGLGLLYCIDDDQPIAGAYFIFRGGNPGHHWNILPLHSRKHYFFEADAKK